MPLAHEHIVNLCEKINEKVFPPRDNFLQRHLRAANGGYLSLVNRTLVSGKYVIGRIKPHRLS